MSEKLRWAENLTEDNEIADILWSDLLKREIIAAHREDILENPTVLDLGGGMGEFSKNLNEQGIKCVSLDIQDLAVDPKANPVRADAYNMPFADGSFNIVYSRGSLDKQMYPHDLPRLLPEIARVLKERGLFFTWDAREFDPGDIEKYFKRIDTWKGTRPLWEKI